MKFKLISKISQVDDTMAYRKVGFVVSDAGLIEGGLELDIDTDEPGFFNSYNKLQNIRRLKDTLGVPIIIQGDNWYIQN